MSVYPFDKNGNKVSVFKNSSSVWSFKYAWASKSIGELNGVARSERCPVQGCQSQGFDVLFMRPKCWVVHLPLQHPAWQRMGLSDFAHMNTQTHTHTHYLAPSHSLPLLHSPLVCVCVAGNKLSVFCLKVPERNLSLLQYSDSLQFLFHATYTSTHTHTHLSIPNCHWIIYANEG